MEAKDAPRRITNEQVEEARRIDAWLRGAMSKSVPIRVSQREAYLTWLRPFALERHRRGFVPKDIARQARDHLEAGTLPGQLRSVIKAVEKILAEDERAGRKRA
jgi:hypothetical protein